MRQRVVIKRDILSHNMTVRLNGMNGYSKYEKLIANWAVSHIKPAHEARKRGEDVPPLDPFFETTFRGFMEISNTLDALKINKVFVSISPPRSRRVKKSEYLKYHISVYLQEIYILKERLKSYARKILRAYSKSNKKEIVESKIKPLFEILRQTMDGLVLTRGAHVHESRYSDDELDRVSMFDLVLEVDNEFEEAFNLSYRLAKSTWVDRIESNREEIQKLLDVYFDEIYMVITENGEIKCPQ